jgi:hypothetical protein
MPLNNIQYTSSSMYIQYKTYVDCILEVFKTFNQFGNSELAVGFILLLVLSIMQLLSCHLYILTVLWKVHAWPSYPQELVNH